VCKIQAKRGASSASVAEQIKPPEWWHSTRIIQAFDSVLQDKVSQQFNTESLVQKLFSVVQKTIVPQAHDHVWWLQETTTIDSS
jgi:EEF1A N-terminal glycine/lysine methyltransferase